MREIRKEREDGKRERGEREQQMERNTVEEKRKRKKSKDRGLEEDREFVRGNEMKSWRERRER